MRFVFAIAGFGALFGATCVMSGDACAQVGHRLRVRGATRIDAHAGRTHEHVLLDGRVVDDAGSAVPSAAFSIRVSSNGVPVDISRIATPCGDAHVLPPSDRAPAEGPHTDESGRFCVWIDVPAPSGPTTYAIHLDVPTTEWLAGSFADYEVDLAKSSVGLQFDPEPRVISLDAQPTTLDAIAKYDDEVAGPATGLVLVLSTERGEVSRATTANAGRATFPIDPKTLGPPGRGVLRVSYAGSTETMASEHTAPIERQARVVMSLAREVEPGSPEDGVAIDLNAAFASVRGSEATPTGAVEVRLNGVIVGAAPIEKGRARVVTTFVAREDEKTASVQVHYVPGASWLENGGDLTVAIPIRGPSPFRQAPLALAAMGVAVWLVLGRRARKQKLDRTIVMDRPPTHEGTAGIAMVKSSRSRIGLYSGRVVDAHDGSNVARARISVQVPSFVANPVVASTFTDEHGAFAFDLQSAPPDAELVVEAPLHAELRQKLPGAGVLEIALVSRRRKLLERLVAWARFRGAPYDIRPEPTPAQVKRAAESSRNAAVAQWADAIEQAAFDRGDVDARVEEEVMALQPNAKPASPPGAKNRAG